MKNAALFNKARALMPGGVNSPVRAFTSVKGTPPFIASAAGATMTDAEGKSYIDYVGSWGPLILGHAHPQVVEAIRKAAPKGTSYGACHENEIHLAEQVQARMPHLQKLRLVNSGTEAAMSALRLARGATGKDRVIKFQGCYHGHVDSFLIQAGSGALTLGTPSSPGVTEGAAKDTLLAQFNDLDSVKDVFEKNRGQVACLVVEPAAGNMGVIPPAEGFLQGLRQLCDLHKALLIFDEVITGFRIHPGGATGLYGVTPDLAIFGKVIGGGMPIGAFGGRSDLMDQMSPTGPVYQAGTLSGNPIACAAGIATLDILQSEPVYEELEKRAALLEAGMKENLAKMKTPWCMNRIGSMSTLFFGITEATTFADVANCDTESYARYHEAMLAEGIYLAPSQYEAAFVSYAHTEEQIQRTLQAQRKTLDRIFDL